MTRTKTAALALVVISMIAALALAVGCSSSDKTLESYIKANQSDWDATVAQIQESGAGIMDVDMSVSGNTITQIMTFKETYSADMVKTMKESLESQVEGMTATVSEQIATIEKEAGVSGVTWHFEYRNGDGTTIASFDVGSK